MAILRGIPLAHRLPSHRGRTITYTHRGILVVAKWPKKRGTPKSALQRWWNDWFTQANKLAKYADPMSQVRAIDMTKGTGLYPRDILLKAMRGRLHWWADETGWKWFPMAATQDVSNSLDTLYQTVGGVLVRALDRWRAPVPGNLDDVLTLKGPDLVPEWAPAAGAGAAFHGALVSTLANQSIANGTWTSVLYTTEAYDTDALHDNAVNPSRMTVPAGWSRVRLSAGVTWEANSTSERLIRFEKNGAEFVGMSYSRMRASSSSDNAIASPAVVVVPGDYFEVRVYQASGSPKNVLGPGNNNYFSMERAS